MRLESWRIEYRPGWVRATDESGLRIFFRLVTTGEGDVSRLRIHSALMDSPAEPISARTWRRVPFRAVEIHALMPIAREILARPPEVDGLDALESYFDRTASDYNIGGVIPTDRLIAGEGEPPAGFSPVKAPGGHISDEFLDNVAAMYRWAVASGKNPAPVIAESAGVAPTTVHRWVAQARKRGLLPPATRGRAG